MQNIQDDRRQDGRRRPYLWTEQMFSVLAQLDIERNILTG